MVSMWFPQCKNVPKFLQEIHSDIFQDSDSDSSNSETACEIIARNNPALGNQLKSIKDKCKNK